MRLAQQRADHDIGAARLVDDTRANTVEIAQKHGKAFLQRSEAQLGATGNHQAGGFTASVGVDCGQGFHGNNRRPRRYGCLGLSTLLR